jgi:hypothetical protein
LCHFSAERGGVDVVDERPLAADFDDREPLPVPCLELVVARDVDLGEPALAEDVDERRARPLAEVAAGGVVERYG